MDKQSDKEIFLQHIGWFLGNGISLCVIAFMLALAVRLFLFVAGF